MYSNQKKRNRNRTIVSRVTRWYTVFVAAIFIAMFSVALVLLIRGRVIQPEQSSNEQRWGWLQTSMILSPMTTVYIRNIQ